MKKHLTALFAILTLITISFHVIGCKKEITEEKNIYADLNPEEVFEKNEIFVKVKREFKVDTLETAATELNNLFYFKDIKVYYRNQKDDTLKIIVAYPDSLHQAVEYASRKIDKMVDQHMFVKRKKFDKERLNEAEELQNQLRKEISLETPDSIRVDSLKLEIGSIMRDRLIWLFNNTYTLAYFVIHE